MKRILEYLRTHKLVWILPLVLLLAFLALLAWQVANSPESPFIYDF